MTNGAGEEKTISVRNKLFELYDFLRESKDIPEEISQTLKERTTELINQVTKIHDKLEDAEEEDYSLFHALEFIADELYYNGVYDHEV